MHRSRRFFVLSSLLMLVCSLFAVVPMGTAFAAPVSSHIQAAPMATNPVNACPPQLSVNSPPKDTWVAVLQFRLDNILNAGLQADGDFGAKTQAAVKKLQSQEFITVDGVVGNETWGIIGFCNPGGNVFLGDTGSTSQTDCPPAQSENASGNTKIYVEAIQDLLNIDFSQGKFKASPKAFTPYLISDGDFGPQTEAAVVDFQDTVGISGGGGVVGQRTWSELGMCP